MQDGLQDEVNELKNMVLQLATLHKKQAKQRKERAPKISLSITNSNIYRIQESLTHIMIV